MQRTPMTRGGFERLQQELDQLKREERPRIIKAIAEARAHGDLSENAEYHAAKERQGFIEGRIRELEAKLSAAEVLDPPSDGARVTFGSTVLLRGADGKEVRYQIVGSDESEPIILRLSEDGRRTSEAGSDTQLGDLKTHFDFSGHTFRSSVAAPCFFALAFKSDLVSSFNVLTGFVSCPVTPSLRLLSLPLAFSFRSPPFLEKSSSQLTTSR